MKKNSLHVAKTLAKLLDYNKQKQYTMITY